MTSPRLSHTALNHAMARGGLASALLNLARSAGAEARVRINGDVDGGIAVLAWFAASKAVTNALKHAGSARIWLGAATAAACLRVQAADEGLGDADPDGRGAAQAGRAPWQVEAVG
jgi:signal transduction histidine kinase